jgi:DUF1680 family protein
MGQYAPINFSDVKIGGEFWHERLEAVLAHSVPLQYRQLEDTQMLRSLLVEDPPPALTIPRNKDDFTQQIFWDSDIGKWVESASYALHHRRDAKIEAGIDRITDQMEKAQLPDGYLNIWYIGREIDNRWTNLRDNHELYCAGHFLEGALAYYHATGKRRLLDLMLRYVDHINETFGPGDNQKHGYPGHQEIELALIKLYRETGDLKHLRLATYFIDERGKTAPHYFDVEARARGADPKDYWAKTYEYNQSHKPVREQTKVVGHAVRAMYMYAAMADLAGLTDDPSLMRACEALWTDAVGKKMYVTGGFGSSADNEGFTTDYDLPNDTAYAETCASVAMILWAQRMLNANLDRKYADVLELALFNGALSGLSADGTQYFYENKLESDGSDRRWDWHSCPCCTMNVSRLIGSVAGFFFSASSDALAIHLYGGAKTEVEIAGTTVVIEEQSNYPWSGKIRISVTPREDAEFTVQPRIPGWATDATATVNGEPVDVISNTERGYLQLRRVWSANDIIELDLPMTAKRLHAHPQVKAGAGRVALRRGPLVYCIEQVDNPQSGISSVFLPFDAKIAEDVRDDLFGGTTVLTFTGKTSESAGWGEALYRETPPVAGEATMTAVPYYLWGNRDPGSMQVWIREC